MIRISRIADQSGVMTQEHYEALRSLVARLDAIEARLTAVAAVVAASGGGTIDGPARAEIEAIKAALA